MNFIYILRIFWCIVSILFLVPRIDLYDDKFNELLLKRHLWFCYSSKFVVYFHSRFVAFILIANTANIWFLSFSFYFLYLVSLGCGLIFLIYNIHIKNFVSISRHEYYMFANFMKKLLQLKCSKKILRFKIIFQVSRTSNST